MTTQTQGAEAVPPRSRTFGQQSWWLLPTVLGGLTLLGFGFYLLVLLALLQQINRQLATLMSVQKVLTSTNDRLARASGQLDEMNTNVKHLTPLLERINLDVARVSPSVEGLNAKLQGATPTLQRLDRKLGITNQHMTTMKQKLDALQVPMTQVETTSLRLRKILPR